MRILDTTDLAPPSDRREAEIRAGSILAECWQEGSPIPPLGPLAPATRAAGQRIGRIAMREAGFAASGLRALAGEGGTGIAGPLIAARLLEQGRPVPLASLPRVSATPALLFWFPAGVKPGCSPRGVASAIAWVAPALDLAVSRWRDADPDAAHRAADLEGHGLVVVGRRRTGATAASLRETRPSIGTGASRPRTHEAGRDPWTFLLETIPARGLAAGDAVLLAGFAPGLALTEPGSVAAGWSGLGKVVAELV